MKKQQTKKPRGRPVKNVIKQIDAPPEDIAKAICQEVKREKENQEIGVW